MLAAQGRAVEFDRNLTHLDRRFAWAVRDLFAENITAQRSADGKLLFRDDKGRTHVEVDLEEGVRAALDFATPLQCELMLRRLIGGLAAQVRAKYDSNRIGEDGLHVVGTIQMLGA